MELRKYANRLENRIGDIKAADKIIEGPWCNVVVKELNQLSFEFAKELQQETGGTIDKGSYRLNLEEYPVTRLLAINLILAYWLGWICDKKAMDGPPISALQRMRDAYADGKGLSEQGEVP